MLEIKCPIKKLVGCEAAGKENVTSAAALTAISVLGSTWELNSIQRGMLINEERDAQRGSLHQRSTGGPKTPIRACYS